MGSEGSRWANLAGALALLCSVAAVAIGLPVINRAVPAIQPVPDDVRFPIGAGVTVVPPAGASLDVSATRPGTQHGSALLILGAVRYALVATAADAPGAPASLSEAEQRLRRKITGIRGYQVAFGSTPIMTHQGVAGRQGSYTSPGRTGWYAVFLAPAGAVEVTISGADQALQGALGPIQMSVRELRFPADDS